LPKVTPEVSRGKDSECLFDFAQMILLFLLEVCDLEINLQVLCMSWRLHPLKSTLEAEFRGDFVSRAPDRDLWSPMFENPDMGNPDFWLDGQLRNWVISLTLSAL